jgi:hypothetical protein
MGKIFDLGGTKQPDPKVSAEIMAFPMIGALPGALPNTVMTVIQPGMTLRDWFAGQYLMTFVTVDDIQKVWDPLQIAKECYNMADAMLAEQKKRMGELSAVDMKGGTKA